MSTNSIYTNLLELYKQMKEVQTDLANELKSHNQQGAEKDIAKLLALVKNLSLEGHEAHFPEGPIATDAIGMEGNLNAMSSDVQSGNFAGAGNADNSFQAWLSDTFHRIV